MEVRWFVRFLLPFFSVWLLRGTWLFIRRSRLKERDNISFVVVLTESPYLKNPQNIIFSGIPLFAKSKHIYFF